MAATPEVRLDPWGPYEALPGLVCVAEPAGRIVYGNGAWQAAFDFPRAGSPRARIVATLHPEDLPGVREAWRAATSLELPYEREQRFRDNTGTYRWYHVAARPLRTPDGTALYACVLTDIDERVRSAHYLLLAAEASDALGGKPNVEAALARIARGIVPLVADWFIWHRHGADGGVTASLVVNADPARARALLGTIDEHGSAAAVLVRRVLADGEPALLADLTPELERSLDARSILVVPVVGRENTWGALQLRNDRSATRPLAGADLHLIREIAKRVAAALDNAALMETAERRADDLRFLAHVGETMVESLDLPSRLNRLVDAVVPRLADWATVNLLQVDGSVETVAIAHGDPTKGAVIERLRGPYYGNLDADHGTPVALRTGRPRLISGVDERFLRTHIRPETLADVRELGADAAFIVPLAAHGEIYGTLSAMRSERERPFVENEMWLIEELARRAAVAIANARLFERNANVAKAFQDASLPASLPSVAGASFSAYYAPGRREAMVGGDWYDAFRVGDGRFVVSIGDVCGSGLSAAVVMGSVRQLIRGAVQLQPDARIILDATDRALRVEFPDTIVTALVAILDLDRRRIAYACAGHPPALLCTPGGIVALDRTGLPLGLRTDAEPAEFEVPFAQGDLLVLYTDGLSESTRDVVAGERSIFAALRGSAVRESENPARALHEAVIPTGAADDDVAILTVRLGHAAKAESI
jgi:PAS domain S-box-containing protein